MSNQPLDDASEDSDERNSLIFFPHYLEEPIEPKCNWLLRLCFWLLQVPIHLLIWVALRPRLGKIGSLDREEVERVYNRQARRYNAVHHFTTRGQDTNWRRMAGWVVANYPKTVPQVLDLCTGTGLTIVEMVNVLREHGKHAEFIGLDYNRNMLAQAETCFAETKEDFSIHLVRGDAMQLVGDTSGDLVKFSSESFDVVTQVLGIGGIKDPIKVFRGVLQILCEGGQFFLVDMHRPIPKQPGEFPFIRWWQMPKFEAYTYTHTTAPLALRRLWGWRDTTLDFYLAPLITTVSDDEHHWGFRIIWRQVESERWWLSLPVMPTARLLLEKVRISKNESEIREKAISNYSTIRN